MLEIVGTAAALVAIILNIRKNRLCWLVWVVSCACYTLLFYQQGLYFAMSLQLFYQLTNAIGWYQWSKVKK